MSKSLGRSAWSSKLGFILAASGSAIGLGNIVFFGANAYKFGGGAFYVPYFIALLVLGIPMMIVELALGQTQRKAFPGAMRATAGKAGEFIAWWALFNAIIIAMYYITILAWVGAMLVKSFGPLYADGAASVGPTFVGVLESWLPLILAFGVWFLNILFLSKGTKTIEKTVKIFVPMMWIFMIILVVRGLTLDNGFQGIWYLFTPDWEGIASPEVWQGAFSQMFFSLSLGLGTMTAYASYLPKNSDVVANGGLVSFMNCSFEFIAGLAIFTMLFSLTLQPTASTLGMSLVVIPSGIGAFPAFEMAFASAFFFLLLIAGLTSSISIVESPVAALQDKFKWARGKALMVVAGIGALGSLMFALPMLLKKGGKEVAGNPLGASLLDLFDHWAFGYSLLIVGLVEAIMIGHFYGIDKLRAQINENARFKLGPWFSVLIKWVIPALIGIVLVFNILNELGIKISALGIKGKGFYEGSGPFDGLAWLPGAVFAIWIAVTIVGAYILTQKGSYDDDEEVGS